MSEDKVLTADVKPTDYPYDFTWHANCSRCRKPLQNDASLILWKNSDTKLAFVYCSTCSNEVTGFK